MQGIICMHGRMARWRVAARCRRQLEGADRWHWVGGADRWVLPAGAGVGRVAFGLAIWLSVWPRPNAVGAVGEQAGQLAGAGAARWPAVQHTLIGSLMYLASCTRPDIAQAVGALARYMSKPTTTHWTAAKHVLRYLAGTTDYGIIFTPSDSTLNAYCDANHAGDIDTRRSTTGYVFTFNSGAITWSSRLQPTVAASTTEAEYMAAASTVKEALWLRKLFTDLDLHIACIDIKSDSQSAIHMLKNPVISLRSKLL